MTRRARVPADRRKAPRFMVHFRSSLATEHERVVGEGIVTDLATGGCRIESQMSVAKGSHLELRIYVPGFSHPTIIEGAPVRWVREEEFGVEFIRLTRGAQTRIRQILQGLVEISGVQTVDRDDEWTG
ncbi:MAG: PilZ domain-containing protein [Nitrospirae bacterium]|nr:MAG: PilZ domain-containing protein [Nitrospirota bacterium]